MLIVLRNIVNNSIFYSRSIITIKIIYNNWPHEGSPKIKFRINNIFEKKTGPINKTT